MERIVEWAGERRLYEGTRLDNAWEIRRWEANGVREVSVRPVIEWEDKGKAPPAFDRDVYLAHYADEPAKLADAIRRLEEDEAERAARSLKKSAQRAKQECRRTIIAEGFDELVTLSYRDNQQDRALCKTHFKEWVRRMTRALPGFRYCASFERQDRGAMHVHLATHKLPKTASYRGKTMEGWRLGTAIWRAIVGKDNGLAFVGGKSANGWPKPKMTLAKLSAYVSKYIMKDYADSPPGSNRYSRSQGDSKVKAAKQAATVERVYGTSMTDVIVRLFEECEGDVFVSHRLSPSFGMLWQVTEPA